MSVFDSFLNNTYHSLGYYYKNYSSKADYYQNLIREDTVQRLESLFRRQDSALTDPNLSIEFRGIPFNSTDRYVLDKMGKARHVYDNHTRIPTHKILFFKSKLHNFKTVSQVHFLENRFFLAKYSFRCANHRDVECVLQVLKQKYFSPQLFGDNISAVKDLFGNALLVENSLRLNIYYLSGDPFFKQWATSQLQKKRKTEQERNQNRIRALLDYL